MQKKIIGFFLSVVTFFVCLVSYSNSEVQEIKTGKLSSKNLIGSYSSKKNKIYPQEIIIKNDIAYLSCSDLGLLILDISDQAKPRRLGLFKVKIVENNNLITDMFVENELVYLVGPYIGLKIIDVSNPKKTTHLGDYDIEGAYYVYVSNGLAYVTNGDLNIIDVSIPSSPLLISSISTGTPVSGIYVSGNYAYMGSSEASDGLQIYDISNPSLPVYVGHSTDAGAEQFIYADGYLYGRQYQPVKIDISNPESPFVVSHLAGEDVGAFDINDSKLYEYTQSDENPFTGILAFDLRSEEIVEQYNYHRENVSDIKVVNGVLYSVADNAFEIFDLEGPPILSSLSNKKTMPGSTLTVNGKYFGENAGTVFVTQDAKTYKCSVVSWSAEKIDVTLPKKLEEGDASIGVKKATDMKSMNSKTITIIKKK
ncbi:MAG: hypothetical protein HZA77_14710 [Candidatus Schekmanbacteria bacterium]|nr:hypothetical protein [Candidatus Schekmanbacteria bacterium]